MIKEKPVFMLIVLSEQSPQEDEVDYEFVDREETRWRIITKRADLIPTFTQNLKLNSWPPNYLGIKKSLTLRLPKWWENLQYSHITAGCRIHILPEN